MIVSFFLKRKFEILSLSRIRDTFITYFNIFLNCFSNEVILLFKKSHLIFFYFLFNKVTNPHNKIKATTFSFNYIVPT
jgi:hypothetical protein